MPRPPPGDAQPDIVTVHVPIAVRRRGGRKTVTSPDGSMVMAAASHRANSADTYAMRAAVIAMLRAMPDTCQELRIAAAKDPKLKPIGEAFPPLKDAEIRAALSRLLDAASIA